MVRAYARPQQVASTLVAILETNTMIIDSFETPLGTIQLHISFVGQFIAKMTEKVTSKFIDSPTLTIEIISFNDVSTWTLENDFPVEKTKGWIIRITKKTNYTENIKIRCELKDHKKDVSSFVDSGEHLDAIWIENTTHFLSIGTEDGEVLKYRATQNDYMPTRFVSELGYKSKQFSFTNYLGFGFETLVPELLEGEKIYFHYLTALNPRKKSKDYPNEDDISTNFAVDFPKRTLIRKLEITE
jgi:hypothetical protein